MADSPYQAYLYPVLRRKIFGPRGPWNRRWRAVSASLALALLVAGGVPFQRPKAAFAASIELDLPVQCRPGQDCWLVQMVDHDPGPGYVDFRCGPLTYDTHEGTDIAIGDRRRMLAGVNVLASAPGVVQSTRDGVPDRVYDGSSLAKNTIAGIDCGNGVVIEHEGGWSTQYCHLRKGSVAVAKGSRVVRGQPIGLVGLSGRTEFPHVHLTVRHRSSVIDPFTGTTDVALCDTQAGAKGLWSAAAREQLAYPGPQPYLAGFATGVPDRAAARADELSLRSISANAEAIVFWVDAFTIAAGDQVEISITGPGGDIVARQSLKLEKPYALWFGYAGRKRRGDVWPVGDYIGKAVIRRGNLVRERTATLKVQ